MFQTAIIPCHLLYFSVLPRLLSFTMYPSPLSQLPFPTTIISYSPFSLPHPRGTPLPPLYKYQVCAVKLGADGNHKVSNSLFRVRSLCTRGANFHLELDKCRKRVLNLNLFKNKTDNENDYGRSAGTNTRDNKGTTGTFLIIQIRRLQTNEVATLLFISEAFLFPTTRLSIEVLCEKITSWSPFNFILVIP